MFPEESRLATAVFAKSLAAKAGLAILKLSVGLWGGSKALVADGINSLSDVLTNGGAWLGFAMAQSPADEDHHYGHGGFEGLTALGIGLLVLGGAGALLWDALVQPPPDLDGGRVFWVVGASVVSIGANLWLAQLTASAGARLKSPTLLALARDNRSDVLASALVVLAAGFNLMGWTWAEPGAAAVIAAMIGAMGFRSAREGLDILMDRVSDGGLRLRIVHSAQSVAGIHSVHHVRVHPLGREHRVDLDVAVDGKLTVAEGHRLARAVEAAVVRSEPTVLAVHVGLIPTGTQPEHAPGSPDRSERRTQAP